MHLHLHLQCFESQTTPQFSEKAQGKRFKLAKALEDKNNFHEDVDVLIDNFEMPIPLETLVPLEGCYSVTELQLTERTFAHGQFQTKALS